MKYKKKEFKEMVVAVADKDEFESCVFNGALITWIENNTSGEVLFKNCKFSKTVLPGGQYIAGDEETDTQESEKQPE